MEDLKKRKPTRLQKFDYNTQGAYFITICTQNRRRILSRVVDGDVPDAPKKIELLPYGKIADNWINQIPDKYPEIFVDSYVIMPNHIHILLSIIKDDERVNPQFVGEAFRLPQEKTNKNSNNGRTDPSPTIDAAIGWFKYQATKDINKSRGTMGERVFQRSFFDHIIRNRDDYGEHLRYIYGNPMCWQDDELYSEE